MVSWNGVDSVRCRGRVCVGWWVVVGKGSGKKRVGLGLTKVKQLVLEVVVVNESSWFMSSSSSSSNHGKQTKPHEVQTRARADFMVC